jgi:hypothetical protein
VKCCIQAHFKGKNAFGEPFENEIITRTKIQKGEDGKLVFTEIIEYIDAKAEEILGKGVH